MANPPSGGGFDWKMYRYVPSLAAAIIALTVFSIMATLHFWQWLKLRNHIILYIVVGTACGLPLTHCAIQTLILNYR